MNQTYNFPVSLNGVVPIFQTHSSVTSYCNCLVKAFLTAVVLPKRGVILSPQFLYQQPDQHQLLCQHDKLAKVTALLQQVTGCIQISMVSLAMYYMIATSSRSKSGNT